MDVESFAYQTAIQQITQQEQGEADNVIGNLSGCWEKEYYYFYWNVIFVVFMLILQFILLCIGWVLMAEEF